MIKHRVRSTLYRMKLSEMAVDARTLTPRRPDNQEAADAKPFGPLWSIFIP